MAKRMLGYDYREHELHLDRATDAAGYWFAAAMLLAFLATGFIAYHTGNPEARPAVNATAAVVQTSPVGQPAAPQH